jgi:predicted PilT family ATPase
MVNMKGGKKQAKKEVERKNNHRIQCGMMRLGFKRPCFSERLLATALTSFVSVPLDEL